MDEYARWLRISVIGCFFFQAEDGIRDLVRSRGLGDVYKRQASPETSDSPPFGESMRTDLVPLSAGAPRAGRPSPVSYTHLTLPTSDLV